MYELKLERNLLDRSGTDTHYFVKASTTCVEVTSVTGMGNSDKASITA